MRAVLALTACALAAACYTTPVNRFAPAALKVEEQRAAQRAITNPIRVRVYADAAFRVQHVEWKSGVRLMLARANRVLEGRFGVSLELAELRDWDRPSRSDELSAALADLEATDDGGDVELVIGCITGLPLFDASFHQIGMTRILGKHIVLRGLDDPGERAFLTAPSKKKLWETDARTLDAEDTYRDRVRHREVSLLLHELGHVLGALHVEDTHDFMNPFWDAAETEYDPANAALIELSLGYLLRNRTRKDKEPEEPRELLEYVAQAQDARWSEAERRELVKTLRGYRALLMQRQRKKLPATAEAHLEEAYRQAEAGHDEEAWAEIAPVAADQRDDARVQAAACMIGARRKLRDRAGREACVAAARLSPDDPAPQLNLVAVLLDAGEAASLYEALQEARARVERSKSPEMWVHLARRYLDASYISASEDAARAAGEAEGARAVLEEAQRRRRYYGLMNGLMKIEAEREPEYVAAARTVFTASSERDAKRVLERAEEALRRFPGAPAILTEVCAAQLTLGRIDRARAACKTALESGEALPRAHLMGSMLASMLGHSAEAVREAERARELDAGEKSTWVFLAEQYRRAHRSAPLAKLREEYKAKFGDTLP